MLVDQITKSVRKVHLTVYWKDGTQTESLDLVTHMVSLGPGTDRNGAAPPGSGIPGIPGVPGSGIPGGGQPWRPPSPPGGGTR
jgi:general secretion pathway protein I